MRVLIIKLSSMGDVLHTLPAITECLAQVPQLQIDWVVEPAFKDILKWHPGVRHVYTFPLRAARKKPKLFFTELPKIIKEIRQQRYDLVIDAQGLIKSAVLAKLAKSQKVVGLDKASCREPMASKLYDQSHNISWSLHAVMRLKHLFSAIFAYPVSSEINYGIESSKLIKPDGLLNLDEKKYIILLHGTTWETKHWPETYWQTLIELISVKYPHLNILLPWGSADEFARATRLAKTSAQAQVLPKLRIIKQTINLYGPTDPSRTGTRGLNQVHLAVNQLNAKAYSCAPCLKRHCVYVKTDNQNFPPCYQIIHPDLVMERLSV